MTEPIPMLLSCPKCSAPHIDEGEWETRLHKTHQCQACHWEWRPALVPTVGVRELTGPEKSAEARLSEIDFAVFSGTQAVGAKVTHEDVLKEIARLVKRDNELDMLHLAEIDPKVWSGPGCDPPISDAEKVQLLQRIIDDTGRIVTPDFGTKNRDRAQLPEMVRTLKDLHEERRKIGHATSNEIRELRNELSEIGKVVAEFNVHDESQTTLDRVRCMASMYEDKRKFEKHCLAEFDAIVLALYPHLTKLPDGSVFEGYAIQGFPKKIRELREELDNARQLAKQHERAANQFLAKISVALWPGEGHNIRSMDDCLEELRARRPTVTLEVGMLNARIADLESEADQREVTIEELQLLGEKTHAGRVQQQEHYDALEERVAFLEESRDEYHKLLDELWSILPAYDSLTLVQAVQRAVDEGANVRSQRPDHKALALIEALGADLRELRRRLLGRAPRQHNQISDRLDRSSLVASIQKSLDKIRDWESPKPQLDKLKELMRRPRPDEAVGDQSKLTEQVRSVNPESLALAAQLPTDAEDERVVDALMSKRAAGLQDFHMIARVRDPQTGNWRVSDSTTIPALGKCYSETEACVGRGAVPANP